MFSSLSEKTRKSNRLQPAFGIYAKNAQKMNHKEPWHNSMFIKILKRKTGKVTVELNSRKMQRTITVVSLSLSSLARVDSSLILQSSSAISDVTSLFKPV